MKRLLIIFTWILLLPLSAQIKISELPVVTTLGNTDKFIVLPGGGATSAITYASVLTELVADAALLTTGSIGVSVQAYSANLNKSSTGFTTDGAGGTVTTGVKGYWVAPYAATITGWSIVADGASPTCTIDVWKVATGTTLPAVGNSIMGTKPALSTGNAVRSTTMTNWTTLAISAGDIIGYSVDAVTVATKLTFQLEISK